MDGQGDNENTTALPDQLFARVIEMTAIEEMIRRKQGDDEEIIKTWQEKEKSIERRDG